MKKKALISGITGQDGSYLADLLLEKDYEVFGIIRRTSTDNTQNIKHIINDINLEYGDLLDPSSIYRIFKYVKPDEVYNLAAQSHVGISFEQPLVTTKITGMGVLHMLEAMKGYVPYSKFYQAGSSEMFGNAGTAMLSEKTPFNPASPYACAKVFAHNISCNYRRAYNLFISNGILFNHESPRRGDNFVTQKIAKGVYEIEVGKRNILRLGNLDAHRDWGHAKDYVRGMWMMLQHDKPDDFVLATGETHSVRDFCEIAFNEFDRDYDGYVVSDSKFKRPEDIKYLCGSSKKAEKELGWKREFSFNELVKDMLAAAVLNYERIQ